MRCGKVLSQLLKKCELCQQILQGCARLTLVIQFIAQFGNVSVDQGYVNSAVGFNIGTGNTANGISGAYLATLGTTDTTFPFKVVSLITDPPGVNGTESGAYQKAVVAFNFVQTKALPGV